MSSRHQLRGPCTYCGRVLTRTGMARHLQACPARQDELADAARSSRPEGRFFHLQAIAGMYWLQLEITGSASLQTLDRYLRAIWLECCGHMSSFTLGGAWGQRIGMARKAEQVLEPGMELTHVYDFGTSSVTLIKVVAERQGRGLTQRPLALMARNEPPELTCMECEGDAKWLCLECVYEHDEDGILCDEHAQTHPHHRYDEPMPIVNSPRVGMCGYAGPAEPPY